MMAEAVADKTALWVVLFLLLMLLFFWRMLK